MKKIAIITLMFLSVAAGANAQPSALTQLINRMISVYGGADNLAQLNNYTQKWDLTAMTNNEKGTDLRRVGLPEALKVELTYPSRHEVRVLNQGRGVKVFNGEMMEAKGPGLSAMRLQLMRLYHPLLLLEKVARIQPYNGDKHFVLALSEGGLVAEFFVNKSTYVIDQVIGKLSMGGQTMKFKTLYRDYKKVKGVLLPHKEVKFAGGVNTAILTLNNVTFLQSADHKPFDLKMNAPPTQLDVTSAPLPFG